MNKIFKKVIKRLFDFLVSLFGIIFLSPLFLVIAILIKLDSRGPVFFKQERVGKNGKIFKIWKFRTMVEGAEKIKDVKKIRKWEKEGCDPRVTKIGKFLRKTALDELPQLFNILKGELSFVGPRAHFIPRVHSGGELWRKRLKVKPGLTSLAIIKGGVNLSEEETIKYDLEYIEKQSFWLDLKILFKTINILRKRVLSFFKEKLK